MDRIKPFCAWRPTPQSVEETVAPPYDVVDVAEARAIAGKKVHNWLHVTKAEMDLDDGAGEEAIALQSGKAWQALIESGVLAKDDKPSYSIYRSRTKHHEQIGLVAAVKAVAVDDPWFKHHELTQPAKVAGRARLIEAIEAQASPVMLAYREPSVLDGVVDVNALGEPLLDVMWEDGVQHSVWRIDDADEVAALSAKLEKLSALYIADGHHRCVANATLAANAKADGALWQGYHLGVLFTESTLQILPYDRLIADLNGKSTEALLDELGKFGELTARNEAVAPTHPQDLGFYVSGSWYQLRLPDVADDALPAQVLHERVIEPVWGITDPKRDPRIAFIGGHSAARDIETAVDGGHMAIGLTLSATKPWQVLDVADSGSCLPPKSTWYEPKLLDGLFALVD